MLPLATQQEKQFIFRGKVQKLHYFSLKVMDFFNKLFLIYGKWLAQQDWAIWYFLISLQDFFLRSKFYSHNFFESFKLSLWATNKHWRYFIEEFFEIFDKRDGRFRKKMSFYSNQKNFEYSISFNFLWIFNRYGEIFKEFKLRNSNFFWQCFF